MKTVTIMQPYLFPYVGYYMLIKLSDHHVIYDDVNFIKKGFINRNIIKNGSGGNRFNVNVANISQNRKISDHYVFDDCQNLKRVIAEAMTNEKPNIRNKIIEPFHDAKGNRLSTVLAKSIEAVCDILEIDTFIECSSSLAIKPYLAGQDRIIEIAKRLEATEYLNLPGGKDLYDEAKFKSCELNLRFLRLPNVLHREESKDIYCQSILGLISNVGLDQVKEIIHSSSAV